MTEKLNAHQKLPTTWSKRELLRQKGQFWTPGWVAEAMVSYVVHNTDLIFDPATGRGAFFEALLKLDKPGISFWGTDIDALVLADEIYNSERCFVEQRDFMKNPPDRKFKAIVGNPPYIRHHRIDEATKSLLRKIAISITGHPIDGRAGYHIYFLIQALNLLEKEGRLAFIMPADTCEGRFAKNLWRWISENFCIDCVITFDKKATPFPKIDINPIVFLIRNSRPEATFQWVKANAAYSDDLLQFIRSGFKHNMFKSLEISTRQIDEGLSTGLSRPKHNQREFKYHLGEFASVMRGIATGANTLELF